MAWHKYKVTLSRLIEEEACIFVTASDENAAKEKAMAEDVAETVWRRADTEPHTLTLEEIEEAN